MKLSTLEQPKPATARACGALALAVMIAIAASCKKHDEPTPPALPPQTAEPAQPRAAVPSATPAADEQRVTWVDPDGWQKASGANPMRKATYSIPKASGDDANGELAVFYFRTGLGGAIEANVDRWVKQFSGVDPKQIKQDKRSANGLLQHTVEIERGTYASGMPGGPTTPKNDYALLGAIVETPSGNYFFKLTGPRKTVREAKPKFAQLLDSIKSK